VRRAIPRGVIYHRLSDDLRCLGQALYGTIDDAAVVARFEAEFAAYVGRAHALAFPSARTAILATLRACAFPAGTEIVMPPITIKPILDVVLACGLVPVFVDLDPETLCFDLEKLESAVTPKTKAILVTYLFGLVPDMDRLTGLCRAHDLFVIEDFSQCLNGSFKGKKIGSFGDVGVYSSSFIKTLDTYGGGQLVCDDPTLLAAIRPHKDAMAAPSRVILVRKVLFDLCMNLATTRAVFHWFVFPLLRVLSRARPGEVIRHLGVQSATLLPTLPKAWFHRYSSLQAALGLRMLPDVAAGDARRRALAERIKDRLRASPLRFPRGVDGADNVYWQLLVHVRDAQTAQRLLHAHGIDTSTTSLTHIAALPRSPYSAETPTARAVHENGLFIPAYPRLHDDDVDHIATVLQREETGRFA
jgi:perosamine synthetase